MKRNAEIVEYLSRHGSPRSVLLAPNAPPVVHTPRGIEVALNVVMDGGDIYDTLKSFFVQAGGREDEALRDSGSFCFAVSSVGRFRVHYATQRGTKVALIALIPFNIPRLHDICVDVNEGLRLAAMVSSRRPGMLVVTGPDAASNNTLIYALLGELNHSQRLIIYVIERSLTYLIAHGESILIQTELGADVGSLEQGLNNALVFEPNVVFVGDLRSTDNVPSLTHAVGSGILTLVSSVSIPGDVLMQRHAADVPAGGRQPLRCVVQVEVTGEGQLRLQIRE